MGFESARLEYSTSRTSIGDYWSYDRFICDMDGSREQVRAETPTKRGTLMLKRIWKYFKRIGCAILNRKCSKDCDCDV
tara:strand:+ start:1741 stop:1974 length:234 start_codon:yes stop_codon:yes gene_type:complete